MIKGGRVVTVGLELGESCCDALDVITVAIVGALKWKLGGYVLLLDL